MSNKVVVIGGGISGMTAAAELAQLGAEVTLLEKEPETGGRTRHWDRLFPSRRPSAEVIDYVTASVNGKIGIHCSAKVTSISRETGGFAVTLATGETIPARAIVVATGYDLFNARKKEEYGYGIYDNVITSAELEAVFKSGNPLTTRSGMVPGRVGIIHCVGSRDEKVGHLYCSKVCCVTGVKQAIEIREMIPECEVFSFYMDLRMFDRNFEELYFEAQQQWGVNFIRGRLSECAENPDHTLVLKTEDTLSGRPLKITVDLAVLLVGFTPRPETFEIAAMLGLRIGQDGFLLPVDEHTGDNLTDIPGVFITGAVKGPACIVNAMADARATAITAGRYLATK